MVSTISVRRLSWAVPTLAAAAVAGALGGCTSQTSTPSSSPSSYSGDGSAPAAPAAPASPTASTGSLIGSWESSDGISKEFGSGGGCRGFFYDSSTGKALDIGGPSSCEQSSTRDESGRYKLRVTQGPNRGTYQVEFHGEDAATVYSKSGSKLYDLTRF